jgi:hypothetical protein
MVLEALGEAQGGRVERGNRVGSGTVGCLYIVSI